VEVGVVKIHRRNYWLKAILLLVVILTAREYARSTYDDSRVWAEMILLGLEERPYVLRVLMPLLARLFWMANMPADEAIKLVIVLSAMAFVYAIHMMCKAFHYPAKEELGKFVVSVLAVELFMIAFFYNNHIYDLSTAAFFAASLGLMATGRLKEYYSLFPLACLNRETTILLSFFFAIHFYKKIEARRYLLGLGYQVFIFITLRLLITLWFADNPGSLFYFLLTRVLSDYLNHPVPSLALLSTLTTIGFIIVRQWQDKPAFLRSALLILLPVQVLMHLLVGMAFEIRVLAEVYPVIFLLGLMGISRRIPTHQVAPARQGALGVVDTRYQAQKNRSNKLSQH
jgi:hypothetical protein